MSGFEPPSYEELVEGNPMVDRGQLDEAHAVVGALRQAGLARPAYRIDSPYERGPVEQPVSITDAEDPESFPRIR
jgi:hypothetical protein